MKFHGIWFRCIALLSLIYPLTLKAGNSTSGGGWITGDTSNPWFLENTKQVRYCIKVDSANFGLSQDRIAELIHTSFEEWREEFKFGRPMGTVIDQDPAIYISLMTQDFVLETSCNDKTDIVFQFGVLDKDQAAYLQKPRQLVAATVRTDYDEENLRGKGYIYFTPQQGALRPDSDSFGDDFWSYHEGILLGRVITHELGHVFGIPHHGPNWSVMSGSYPEAIIKKWRRESDIADQHLDLEVFKFRKAEVKGSCMPKEHFIPKMFGLSDEWHCGQVTVEKDVVTVYAKRKESDNWSVAGKASLLCNSLDCDTKRTSELIRIRVTPKQKVFPITRPQTIFLTGPWKETRRMQAVFSNYINGSTMNMFVELSPSDFTINTIDKNGRITFNALQQHWREH